jgi:hypothetical protein
MKRRRKSESARTLAGERCLALDASLAKGREQLSGELRIGPTAGTILSIYTDYYTRSMPALNGRGGGEGFRVSTEMKIAMQSKLS